MASLMLERPWLERYPEREANAGGATAIEGVAAGEAPRLGWLAFPGLALEERGGIAEVVLVGRS